MQSLNTLAFEIANLKKLRCIENSRASDIGLYIKKENLDFEASSDFTCAILDDVLSRVESCQNDAMNSLLHIRDAEIVETDMLRARDERFDAIENCLKIVSRDYEDIEEGLNIISLKIEKETISLKKLAKIADEYKCESDGDYALWEKSRINELDILQSASNNAIKNLLTLVEEGGNASDIDKVLENVFETLSLESVRISDWRPPIKSLVGSLKSRIKFERTLLKKMNAFVLIVSELKVAKDGWSSASKESTSLDNLHTAMEHLDDADDFLAAVQHKRKKSKTFLCSSKTIDNVGFSLDEALNSYRSASGAVEMEFVRLTKLANKYFPEIKSQLNSLFSDDYNDINTFGRSLKSYNDCHDLNSSGRHVIYQAKLGSHSCILKRFDLLLQKDKSRFYNEARSLTRLNHPNVVKIEAVFVDDDNGFLQMAYYCNGDLSQFLISQPNLKDAVKQSISRNLLCGLDYLHRMNIVHCDLKPQNIFIDQNFEPKIGDFDVSKEALFCELPLTTTIFQPAGTFLYLPPDAEQGFKLSSKSDMYSFGLILFDMHFPAISGEMQRPTYFQVFIY